MAALVERGLRTLCFAKSRKSAELIHRSPRPARPETRRALARTAPATRRAAARDRAAPRRGRAARRRATDALELGIDIGCSTASISVGFPGTVASLRQQWGRAGRRGHGLACSSRARTRSTSTSCASRSAARPARRGGDPRPREPARARRPRRAAAFEAPIDDADRDARRRGARARARSPELQHDAARLVWAGKDYPPRASAPLDDPDAFTSSTRRPARARPRRARARVLDRPRGRVYLHLGEPYLVRELDLARTRALVEPFAATGTRRRRRRRRPRSRSRAASAAAASSSPSAASR
jgi:DEAD/DEAH box helicase domain-containing protein